jgi:hypothetical protein
MLTTLASLKTFLRIASSDTSQDTLLTQILTGVDSSVKRWCKQNLEQQVYVQEFYDGTGSPDVALYQRPVTAISFTGAITAGSAVLTSPSSTVGLVVGMPVAGVISGQTSGIAPGSAITSLAGGNVTMSLAALASGTVTATAGLAVWYDPGGFYGDAPNGFGNTTQLVLGVDYVLVRDQSNGTSKSAILRRLGGGGVLVGSVFSWPWEGRRGALTAKLPPIWAQCYGGIKVQYSPGYATIPADLQQAVNGLCSWVRELTPAGTPLDHEEVKGQVMELMGGPLAASPQIASIQRTLNAYRDMVI